MNIPHSITSTGISLFVNGKPHMISTDHINYVKIIDAIKAKDVELIKTLVDVKAHITKATIGKVIITEDDEVYFNSLKVDEYLTTRIVDLMEKDLPIDSICLFTEKLMTNPDIDVRNDLYRWLENGNTPIFEDGDFLAYKVVRDDFTSFHDPDVDNSPGETVKEDRELCDNNRNNTCSKGLHFCSYDYLSEFGAGRSGSKVILLRINPANVVAIPTDYNMTKGRCCEYYVEEEIEYSDLKDTVDGSLVYSQKDDDDDDYYKGDAEVNDDDMYDEDEKENLEITFKSSGKVLKQKDLEYALEKSGNNITQASKILGIPRTTLGNWLRKLNS